MVAYLAQRARTTKHVRQDAINGKLLFSHGVSLLGYSSLNTTHSLAILTFESKRHKYAPLTQYSTRFYHAQNTRMRLRCDLVDQTPFCHAFACPLSPHNHRLRTPLRLRQNAHCHHCRSLLLRRRHHRHHHR